VENNKIGQQELARYYRAHLLDEVMPFWESRTADFDSGGYFTFFDRAGNVMDKRKFIWVQARQTYMFSSLYRQIEKRPEWLALATHGRDFLVNHAYAGNGRWYYQLDQYGKVEQADRSMATDAFALMGLSEYAAATGSDDDAAIIEKSFDKYERNTNDPNNVEFFHFVFDPAFEHHSPYMLAVNVCSVVRDVLGDERVRMLMSTSMDKVLYTFANDTYHVLFETLQKDGSILDTVKGRTVNPGHSLESMWFCMEEGLRRSDRTIIDRCIEISRWNIEKAWDVEYGGIFAFIDPKGEQVEVSHSVKGIGEIWDSKIWWVHSEALYTLALCALYDGGELFKRRFLELHRYVRNKFYDPEYGEWYMYLNRDGSRYDDRKGNGYKSAFHVPRALMKLVLLFEKQA
jgi:N-acylglucosamine 2-epimerase